MKTNADIKLIAALSIQTRLSAAQARLQSLGYRLHRNPQTRGPGPIDLDSDLRLPTVNVDANTAQPADSFHPALDLFRYPAAVFKIIPAQVEFQIVIP